MSRTTKSLIYIVFLFGFVQVLLLSRIVYEIQQLQVCIETAGLF